jgi:molybdate transport system substrate-binding protein
MRRKVGAIVALIIVATLVIILSKQGDETEKTLFLYSGGGLRLAVNECVDIFSRENDAKIECNYAGSGVLLNQVQVTKQGDLFMPGDAFYIDKVEPPGFIESKHKVCYFIPEILVRKGNPKNIESLEDLVKPGLRLGLGDSEVCAIGRTSVQIFEKNNINMEDVQKNTVFNSLTVGELGVQIEVGKVDAVIVWDSTAAHYADSGDTIKIPRDRNVVSTVAIALLGSSRNKELAGEFIDFVTSTRGQEIFRKHHFSTELPE